MGRGVDVLTVTCVWVQGEYPYTADYVTRLEAMARRWIARPFRFVCLTDQPWAFQSPIDTVPIACPERCSAPWAKLEVFNPARRWGGRVLYLDLDSLIVAPLDSLIDTPAECAITDDPPKQWERTRDRFGRRIIRRVNSSVMAWDGGTMTSLYTTWSRRVAQELSGDQDWIGQEALTIHRWPRAWFPRISEAVRPPWPTDAKVILCKVPKNHVLAQEQDWFAPLWGAA